MVADRNSVAAQVNPPPGIGENPDASHPRHSRSGSLGVSPTLAAGNNPVERRVPARLCLSGGRIEWERCVECIERRFSDRSRSRRT